MDERDAVGVSSRFGLPTSEAILDDEPWQNREEAQAFRGAEIDG